jgi:hypothetical protein
MLSVASLGFAINISRGPCSAASAAVDIRAGLKMAALQPSGLAGDIFMRVTSFNVLADRKTIILTFDGWTENEKCQC